MTKDVDPNARKRMAVVEALARLFEGLVRPEATAILYGLKPAEFFPGGARVAGTSHELRPERAAALMTELAALVGSAPREVYAVLAAGDMFARDANLRGEAPETLASLYPAIPERSATTESAELAVAFERLTRAVQPLFAPKHAKRLRELCEAWLAEPASLDAQPVQKFVAQFIRNAPP